MRKIFYVTGLLSMLYVQSMIVPTGINAQERNFTGNLNFIAGSKQLISENWGLGIYNFVNEFGAELDFRHRSWPLSLDIGYLTGEATTGLFGNLNAKISELSFGLKKNIKPLSFLNINISGGVVMVDAEIDFIILKTKITDEDQTTGYYVSFGMNWILFKRLNIGYQARLTKADMDLFGATRDAGGVHSLFLIGFNF